ncbi:hypothetical protein [Treponema sp.]|uniref:hypothetical protein n=1 Tax=Treponema sp. TaxID=166 RepID=UPI00298DFD43|nr:hypothetical protein [Treponema sp.]MCQ2240022.1 hypothetical protein [Treponema sp.]
MHPDQDVESHIQNIGNEFLTPKGETKTFKNGVVFLATGTMMRWNKNDSIQGMGNQLFLSYMVNLMNNRDLIEYSDNDELRACFAELCNWLIEKGKNTYINGFDFSFESDEYIIYDKHDWRIQERTNRSGKKGLIIFDKDGKGNLLVENIPTINPVIR